MGHLFYRLSLKDTHTHTYNTERIKNPIEQPPFCFINPFYKRFLIKIFYYVF